VALCFLLLYGRCEAISRNQLENLAKDAAYSFQGEASSVEWSFLPELKPNYQRLRLLNGCANLDTSDLAETHADPLRHYSIP
jgi:hypothetical protein